MRQYIASPCINVDINDLTGWFDANSGVKQGYILSPTLFIDDLVDQLGTVKAGVACGKCMVSSPLYALLQMKRAYRNKLGK